jgi:hypothetical protein
MLPRLLIACATVGGCALVAGADDAEVKKAAKAKAEESQAALVKGDYGKLAELTHPKIVEMVGGKEKMAAGLTGVMKKLKEQGIEYKSAKMLEPGDLIRSGKDIYVTVPFTLEMVVPGGRLHSKSALIGVSNDAGKNWVFIDGSLGSESIKKVFPDLPDAITFPKQEPPVFVKD